MNITALDWAVLIGYLVIITAIGLVAGYRVRRRSEYFLGGRRFGPWLMIAQSFGAGTHAEMPVALAGAVYVSGASGIWFQWKNLFITPFYWIMAPVFRRIRRTTMAEFTEDRYGPWMAAIYSVFAICFFVIETSGMLKGAGKVISQATGGTVGIMAQPHMVAAVGTGRDERTCRIGMFYGNYVKRVCTVGWMLVGLIVGAMIAQGRGNAVALDDPENAFGFACRQLLFPGALGLLIASILATNMSACSAFMVDSGALFTEGLYRRRLVPNRPDRHYLWVGRVSGLAITAIGVLYAVFLIQSVLYTFLLTETLATFVGISVLVGIVWRRANRWGALASLLVALTTNFALYSIKGQRLDYWDANVFLAALLAGIAALVIVSILTSPEPSEAIASFFGRLETSSDDDVDRPLLLVHLLRMDRATRRQDLRTYRDDLTGFAVGWLMVLLLVGATAIFLAT